ncbi:MAG: NAD(P)-binding protein, partial [Kineosporiaceae bacterium]
MRRRPSARSGGCDGSVRDADRVDVLIVGAGLSGVGAACHVQLHCPGLSYAILEARHAMGGTWDLFRYPGVRSDSDMFTLGYSFRPWPGEKAIADGPSIRRYIENTARDHGVAGQIRYHHRVLGASWSTPDARWTVRAERTDTGETVEIVCRFLYMCTGYYRYDRAY